MILRLSLEEIEVFTIFCRNSVVERLLILTAVILRWRWFTRFWGILESFWKLSVKSKRQNMTPKGAFCVKILFQAMSKYCHTITLWFTYEDCENKSKGSPTSSWVPQDKNTLTLLCYKETFFYIGCTPGRVQGYVFIC